MPNVRSEARVQIAIVIDIAFMVVVFLFVSLVRPDLHIESGRSLLEFRDPLSLRPKTENVSADENREASQQQCVPIKRREGEQIEDRRNCLRHKIVRWLPIPTSKR
jgi:hypothetical protein